MSVCKIGVSDNTTHITKFCRREVSMRIPFIHVFTPQFRTAMSRPVRNLSTPLVHVDWGFNRVISILFYCYYYSFFGVFTGVFCSCLQQKRQKEKENKTKKTFKKDEICT